jgi:hypothetical protein
MGKQHIFSAHAPVPSDTDISQRHKFVCIIMRCDIDSGEIVDCHVPMYTPIQNNFVKEVLIGKSLHSDKEAISGEIDELMHTPSKRALISAIQGVHNSFVLTRKAIVSGRRKTSARKDLTDAEAIDYK